MLTRLLAGVVGLTIVLPAIIWGGHLAIQVIVAIAVLIGLDEYSRMAVPGGHKGAMAALVVGGCLVFAAMAWAELVSVAGGLALSAVVVLLYALFAVRETDKAAGVAMRLIGGVVYIPFLLTFVVWVRRFDDGVAWIFLILAITWLGDTGAYFAGRALGRHKLFERVSPKKTWEGAVGGLLLAVVGACVVKYFGLPNVSWTHAIVLGVVLDTFGVLGDLVESMLKRSFGVKDSGWIMPGHGGILDRIDSLLFTAPLAWLYATAFGLG